jgi:hypothetical protein
MNNRELSNLSLERKECSKCGAIWINGEHRWAGNGNKGNELDLAGLVCNKHGDETCINPCKGMDGGQTWKSRMGYFENLTEKSNKMLDDYYNS